MKPAVTSTKHWITDKLRVAFKAYRRCVNNMRATGMAAFLCLLLVCTTIPFQPSTNNQLAEETVIAQSNSDVTITFTNGPSSSQSLTGVYTLSFSFGGSGTVTSLTIEISDGTTLNNVATLTTSPWVTYLDTTTLANGSYTLKATAYDDTVAENVVEVSPSFTIDNQVPIITQFTVDNIEYGTGSSAIDRAWFSIDSTAALEFSWNAADDDLLRATLTNVPGPGAPASDGPSSIAYGWDWTSGSFDEGTWNPRLTVYDNSGLSVTETMFIGIDRTGPTIGTITSGSSSGWLSSSSVTLSGLINAVDDGQGSGLAYTEISLDGASWTQNTLDSYTLNLNDGSHTISIRAADNVGNIGPTTQISVQVDTEDPIANGWLVDELTTALTGSADVEFLAIDESSGIDNTNSFIEYGFDANGFGQTPDLSGSWQASMGSGLDSEVAQSSWATKSRQYLMLRATVTDIAGNSFQTNPVFYQILPSLDFEWNLTETNVDRLIVKPGDSTGNITVSGLLEVNENYGGTITLRLESAPADRDAQVAWTVIESRTLDAGLMTDQEELLVWNYTVPSKGQFDLRLVIDPNNVIDEYNENNNQNYMVVTGASVSSVINAPSFSPPIGAIIVCAFVISLLQRNTRD